MRLVIIGGGISGLIANYIARQCRGVEVFILEAGKVGGEFASVGLKYIHRTDEMATMLADLQVVYNKHPVRGGIHLHGRVWPYPEVMKPGFAFQEALADIRPEPMTATRALRIQHDHWRKTRHTEPDHNAGRSMNDPEAGLGKVSLRCDLSSVVAKLAERAIIVRERVVAVAPDVVSTDAGNHYEYDYIIVTVPLWLARRMMYFGLPEAMALKLNVVHVVPISNPYVRWDYVYTPYTPDSLIHRISPSEDGWSCEFNGAWEEGDPEVGRRLTSDLNFLFQNGWAVNRVVRGINGHLIPMEQAAGWPSHIQPLGRFAQWDSRATADVVLDRMCSIVDEWGWRRCRIE